MNYNYKAGMKVKCHSCDDFIIITEFMLKRSHYECKQCLYEKYKIWMIKNARRVKQVDRKYRIENKEKYNAHNRAYFKRYPLRSKARNAVSKAIKDGLLIRKPCEVCGDKKSHAHHDDYNKPLDVRWLCGNHHAEFHHPNRVRAITACQHAALTTGKTEEK